MNTWIEYGNAILQNWILRDGIDQVIGRCIILVDSLGLDYLLRRNRIFT